MQAILRSQIKRCGSVILIVAALGADAPGALAQAVIELESLGTDKNGLVIRGALAFELTGTAADGAGDFNGDGLQDLVVASPGGDPAGYASVIYGHVPPRYGGHVVWDLPGLFGVSFLGTTHDFAESVAGVGDVNSDGFADILVSRRHYGAPAETPVSHLLFGRPVFSGGGRDIVTIDDLDGTNGVSFFLSHATHSSFKKPAVAELGDVNHDGVPDLAVSTDGPGEQAVAYVVFGDTSYPPLIDLDSLNGINGFKVSAGLGFGDIRAGAGIGDVNGDGYGDMAFTSNLDLPVSEGDSACVIVYGRSDPYPAELIAAALPPEQGSLVYGNKPNEAFCSKVGSAGDFNADGIGDFAVSTFTYFETPEPRAIVVYGRSSGFGRLYDVDAQDSSRHIEFRRAGLDTYHFLVIGAKAGDLNGDGVDDLVIGVPDVTIDWRTVGETHLIFGPAIRHAAGGAPVDLLGMTGNEGLTLRGGTGLRGGTLYGDRSGDPVTIAPDFSGNGLADALIGASAAQPAGYTAVVFGNSAPTASDSAVLLPPQLEDDFVANGTTVQTTFSAVYEDDDPIGGVAIVANTTPAQEGRWQFRAPGSPWVDIDTAVSDQSAVVLAHDGFLRFVPAPDFFGRPQALAVRLWDGRLLSTGPEVDVTAAIGSLGGVSNDVDIVSLGISVVGVNDPPTFVAKDPPPVLTGEPVAISAWADFNAGATNENQIVSFHVTGVSRPDFFQQLPAVAPDGTLIYQAVPEVIGQSDFVVTAMDDGGTANGGSNTSEPMGFVLTFDQIIFASGFEQ